MIKIEKFSTFELIKNNVVYELSVDENNIYTLIVNDLENENVKTINISDYVYFNRKRYYVTSIFSDFLYFSCEKVKKINCSLDLLNKNNLLQFKDIILEKNMIEKNVYEVMWINPDIKLLNIPLNVKYLTSFNKTYTDILLNKFNYIYNSGKFYYN